MTKYEFEIQNCIKVEIEADNQEDARHKLINNLEQYGHEMVHSSYVSDGRKIK